MADHWHAVPNELVEAVPAVLLQQATPQVRKHGAPRAVWMLLVAGQHDKALNPQLVLAQLTPLPFCILLSARLRSCSLPQLQEVRDALPPDLY